MKRFIGCDTHKKYLTFASMNEAGHSEGCIRVDNDRVSFRSSLRGLPPRSTIAIESVGNWYWMIEEMERAGHVLRLAHAGKTKVMAGQTNKTDRVDARGLDLLLHNGILPSVWIPPGELRDQRELPRLRMALVHVRTMLKNCIHATLAKYALQIPEVSNIFGVTGQIVLRNRLKELPPYTRGHVDTQLELLDQVETQIQVCEKQIKEAVAMAPAMKMLMTLPGVGLILAVVMAMEIGDIERFPTSHHLASYTGTVPRSNSSGGGTYFRKVRPDVNRYLRWALLEAGNVVVIHQSRWSDLHVAHLYRRIMKRKGYARAVVAVAKHLAYGVLRTSEPYKEPRGNKPISSARK